MNLSKIIAEVGPSFLQSQIAALKAQGADTSFYEEYGPLVLNAVTDLLLEKETKEQGSRNAHFIAHIAADLLRGWPGEPNEASVDLAVQLAKRLVAKAEK